MMSPNCSKKLQSPLNAVSTVVSVLFCLCISSSTAQNIDFGSLEELFNEPVTTSVTGSPQRASDVPGSMIIITAEEIRRSGAHDLPALLKHITGLGVSRWTINGADVGIRGYNSAYSPRILVLINGRQVYADHFGYTHWASLPVALSEIRQIEIVKGPNGALLGFNAVDGAINIITYGPSHDDRDVLRFNAGTQDFYQAELVASLDLSDRFDARISAVLGKNDGFDTAIDPANARARQENRRASLTADVHYTLSNNSQLEFEVSASDVDQTDLLPSYLFGYQNIKTKSVKASYSVDSSIGLIKASGYRNFFEKTISLSINDFLTNELVHYYPWADVNDEATVFKVQNIMKIGAPHVLRLSAEYKESNLDTLPYEGGNVFFDVLSFGAMWEWDVSPHIVITNAIRHDGLQLGRKGLLPVGYPFANTDWERDISQTTANTGFVWRVNDYNTFRFTAARGAQLPSLYNLGGSLTSLEAPGNMTVFISGNPSLKPSETDSFELAWDHQGMSNGMKASVVLFSGKTRDVISNYGAQNLPLGLYSIPANIGNSEAQGVEITIGGRLDESWDWKLGYIYEDIDDSFSTEQETLDIRTDFENVNPRHVVDLHLGWTAQRWEVDAFLRYRSDAFVITSTGQQQPLLPISDFITLDTNIRYLINNNMSVNLSGYNVLEKEQRQTFVAEVERRVMLGLTYDF